MIDVVTTLSTSLFRAFIIKRYMSVFFKSETEDKKKERIVYFLYYILTTGVYLAFHFPPFNIIATLTMLFVITQIYEGQQKKKILVSLLIYGISMACDILAVYSLSDYTVGGEYNQMAVYIEIFLASICEFTVEKFIVKKREIEFAPPYWNLLILIPVISIIILFVLMMNNLNNQIILVVVSAGILFINILIFYLYHALLDAYLKLEENAVYERQIKSYENQLEVLAQSEEKVSALRHDIKHHLNELWIMTNGKEDKQEIAEYIQNMQMSIENKKEYSYSGNHEIDSILNYMLNKAEEVLDKVEYKISIPEDMGIQSFDMNIVFGNLLENAICAAGNSEKKWLAVFVQYNKGMLFINIQNSYTGNLNKKGTVYLSTKEDKGKHGIGLRNVERVVKKYNGNMEISDTDSVFDVKIMLYMS